jgi:L-alanine-DL-glutamate epimerase-like enolase superfamily enzyme
MRIAGIETLRTPEYVNVLWVLLHTDEGIAGLGETFCGAGAVAAHIHEAPAARRSRAGRLPRISPPYCLRGSSLCPFRSGWRWLSPFRRV